MGNYAHPSRLDPEALAPCREYARISEDPVLFALKDRFSLAMGGMILLILMPHAFDVTLAK